MALFFKMQRDITYPCIQVKAFFITNYIVQSFELVTFFVYFIFFDNSIDNFNPDNFINYWASAILVIQLLWTQIWLNLVAAIFNYLADANFYKKRETVISKMSKIMIN